MSWFLEENLLRVRSRHAEEHEFCNRKKEFSGGQTWIFSLRKITLEMLRRRSLRGLSATCVLLLKRSDFRSSISLKIHAVAGGTASISANR